MEVKVPRVAQKALSRHPLSERVAETTTTREVIEHDCATRDYAILDDIKHSCG